MATIDCGNINAGNHGNRMLSKLYDLRNNCQFLDACILVKGRSIYAHRAILAAASPFFLEKSCNFKGMQWKLDLEQYLVGLPVDGEILLLIIEYIYKGQVQVPEIKLGVFLSLGTHLQIEGLCKESLDDSDKSDIIDEVPDIPPQNILPPFLSDEQICEAISAGDTIDCFDVDQPDIMTSSKPIIKSDTNYSNSSLSVTTILEQQSLSSHCKIGGPNNEFHSNEVREIFYIANDIQPSIYLNEDIYEPQFNSPGINIMTDNNRTIFDENSFISNSSGTSHDVFMSSCEPSTILEHNTITDHDSIEHLLAHTYKAADDPSLLPERQCSQARLKVKDSIGGVSLQDTSQGDKNNVGFNLLSLGKTVQNIEQYTSETQYEFSQDSNRLNDVNEASTSSCPKEAEENGCTQCKKVFTNIEVLTQHLWDAHQIGTFHNCKLCDFQSLSENLLVNHGKIHFNDNKTCCICGKLFKTKTTLRNHVLSHSSDRWFQCTHCNSHYTQRHNLVKHLASEHQLQEDGTAIKTEMKCDKCPYVSFAAHKLNQHKIRSHTQNKRYKCDKCTYSSTEKTTLSKHLRTHTKERPYVCDTCGNCLVTISSLRRHIQTHTKAKPYFCKKCGKEYADGKRLRDHYLKHKSLKPHRCQFCDYSTIRNDNLKNHINRSHPSQIGNASTLTEKDPNLSQR